jgi:hypothetical protein
MTDHRNEIADKVVIEDDCYPGDVARSAIPAFLCESQMI